MSMSIYEFYRDLYGDRLTGTELENVEAAYLQVVLGEEPPGYDSALAYAYATTKEIPYVGLAFEVTNETNVFQGLAIAPDQAQAVTLINMLTPPLPYGHWARRYITGKVSIDPTTLAKNIVENFQSVETFQSVLEKVAEETKERIETAKLRNGLSSER
jgi:hypothetical protein